METFERLGVAILKEIAHDLQEGVRMWGRFQVLASRKQFPDLVADIREGKGPNVINRENAQRRIVIAANTSERDLESLVQKWDAGVKEKVKLPEGYFL
ncbi:MAG: hypothetical protein HC782_05355, partial [Gammaproteobacteria bacterium]|nr:hypothetical protein [Gammaproteobacteria bacterium]